MSRDLSHLFAMERLVLSGRHALQAHPDSFAAWADQKGASCGLPCEAWLDDGRLLPWRTVVPFRTGEASTILLDDSPMAVAFLQERNCLIAAVGDALVEIDLVSGSVVHCYEGHSDDVTCAAALDGGRFVSGSRDGTLRVWHIDRPQALSVYPLPCPPSCLAVSLDRRWMLVGSSNGQIAHFRLRDA